MRNNSRDDTLKKNYIQKYRHLIAEYELVKTGNHPRFKLVGDFYAAHGTCRQVFLKYYGRWRQSGGDAASLLPAKRGPRYKSRRTDAAVEALVIEQRSHGCNKYDIASILKPMLGGNTPAPSTIYNILKRHGMNHLTPPMQEEKRRIIKEKAGELAHIDCHHLSRDMIAGDSRRYYLVCVIDSCTRIGWAEMVTDISALSVMFASLACLNQIAARYDIRFQEVLTDNGPEFGPRQSMKKHRHPFERMLIEMNVVHRYTRPYRPQTNGKAERFWRTLNEDLITATYFESVDKFKKELLDYMIYYNQLRPHQALAGKTPQQFNNDCQRIT